VTAKATAGSRSRHLHLSVRSVSEDTSLIILSRILSESGWHPSAFDHASSSHDAESRKAALSSVHYSYLGRVFCFISSRKSKTYPP